MLDATHGSDPGAPFEIAPPTGLYVDEVEIEPAPLRIAWTTKPTVGSSVDRDAVDAIERTAELLTAFGHDLVEAHPTVDGESFARAFLTMVSAELAADLADAEARLGRKARRIDLEPATWALALLAEAISAKEFAGALRTLERVGRDVGRFFEEYDVLLTPSLAFAPPEIGALAPSRSEDRLLRLLGSFGSGRLIKAAGLLDEAAKSAFEFTPWTPVYNVTGQPAMSVPLEWSESGLPIGVHFVGRFGREDTLFRLAGQLERSRPWFDRLPPIARTPHDLS
jgi:amidase